MATISACVGIRTAQTPLKSSDLFYFPPPSGPDSVPRSEAHDPGALPSYGQYPNLEIVEYDSGSQWIMEGRGPLTDQ